MKVGSIVKAVGVLCRVTHIGKDEEGKIWVEVKPIKFDGIEREFQMEELEEVS